MGADSGTLRSRHFFMVRRSEPVSTKLVYASPISPAAQRQFSFSQKRSWLRFLVGAARGVTGAPRMPRSCLFRPSITEKCLDLETVLSRCAYWLNPPQTALASSQHKAQKILNSCQTSITRLSFLRPLPLPDVRALLNALEMRRGCCVSANFVDPRARFAIDFGESNYRSVLMMPGGHDLV